MTFPPFGSTPYSGHAVIGVGAGISAMLNDVSVSSRLYPREKKTGWGFFYAERRFLPRWIGKRQEKKKKRIKWKSLDSNRAAGISELIYRVDKYHAITHSHVRGYKAHFPLAMYLVTYPD